MGILCVGNAFPQFRKIAVVSVDKGHEFLEISSNELKNENDIWTVMFWWPRDLSFICPTELAEFNKAADEFTKRSTRLIGASTDSEFIHLAWRKSHVDLKNLKFPMLADTSTSLAEELGILEADKKVAYRATFIIDPGAIVRWVSVYDLSTGRNVKEVLRVIDALQTGELCPCNWEKGQETLRPI